MYRFTYGKGSSFWVWRAGPFSCTDLPLVDSSWRTGWGRTLNLTPHLPWSSSLGLDGRRYFRLGFGRTPECLPFTVLLYHEALLFPFAWTWKTCPPFQRGNGFLPFLHRSLPWLNLGKVAQVRGRLQGRPPYPLSQNRQGWRSLVLIRRHVRLSLWDIKLSNLRAVRA